MKVIYKYTLWGHFATVYMPDQALILSIQYQEGVMQLWALVDTSKPKVSRSFTVYGTGQDLPDDPGEHLATLQTADETLVWHVFENKPKGG